MTWIHFIWTVSTENERHFESSPEIQTRANQWRTVKNTQHPNRIPVQTISITNRVRSIRITDPAFYYSSNDSPNGGTLLVGGGSSDSADLINGLHTQSTISSSHEIRSPLAATRANSLASAASPTGSACILPRSSQQTSETAWNSCSSRRIL